ncbi:hypothetical protein N665_0198s0245 [Sinapis alba]|nr:hypothetical protein N665_0198s0245 [Sinapis alba]
MENGNGEGKGEFINQNNNDYFLDSMSMLSSLPPCWDSSLPPPPPPPPPQSLLHALTVDASFPDQFHHPQESGGPSQDGLQGQGTVSTTSAPVARQKPRVRARRGQATDPHSIAERLRRERIAERMKSLQELVPNTNKTDKASMLDEIIEYVRFLQLQVKVLSVSRLGGARAAGGPGFNGLNALSGPSNGVNGNGNATGSSNESLRSTEQRVAKLMEEDMGSAMQYLQGKGLCLMPISLATAISSSSTSNHSRGALFNPSSSVVAAVEGANVAVASAAAATPEASSTMDDDDDDVSASKT